MIAELPHTLDYLNQLPRKIRKIIFTYMIHNTLEPYEQIETPEPRTLGDPADDFPSLGFDTVAMREHPVTSPQVMLNKQYCVKYLKLFLEEIETQLQIPEPCLASSQEHTGSEQKPIDEEILQLINTRFGVAVPQNLNLKNRYYPHTAKESISPTTTTTPSSSAALRSQNTESFPTPEHYLIKSVEALRQLDEKNHNIPAEKFIPRDLMAWRQTLLWSILACCEELENRNPTLLCLLRPLHAENLC